MSTLFEQSGNTTGDHADPSGDAIDQDRAEYTAAQPTTPRSEIHLDRNLDRIWDQHQEKEDPPGYPEIDREEATIDLQTVNEIQSMLCS